MYLKIYFYRYKIKTKSQLHTATDLQLLPSTTNRNTWTNSSSRTGTTVRTVPVHGQPFLEANPTDTSRANTILLGRPYSNQTSNQEDYNEDSVKYFVLEKPAAAYANTTQDGVLT